MSFVLDPSLTDMQRITPEHVDGPLLILAGPGSGLGSGCACFDFDNDGDSDLGDFAAFQLLFTSPD